MHKQTLYNWKSKYVGLEVCELVELKKLREENRQLKTMVAKQAPKTIQIRGEVTIGRWA